MDVPGASLGIGGDPDAVVDDFFRTFLLLLRLGRNVLRGLDGLAVVVDDFNILDPEKLTVGQMDGGGVPLTVDGRWVRRGFKYSPQNGYITSGGKCDTLPCW